MAEKKVLVLNPATGELQQHQAGDTVFGLAPNQVAATAAALVAETTAREAADASLQSALNAEVTARDAAIASAVLVETTNRQAADGLIQTEVDAIETAVGLSAAGAYVAPAGTNYLDGTATVMGALSALDTAVASASSSGATKAFVGQTGAEMPAYTTTNFVVQGTNLETAVSALDAALFTESTVRAAADTSLQSALAVEVTARQATDAALTAEVTNRQNADVAEASARIAGDQAQADALAVEATARAAADSALQTALNAEVTNRQAADGNLSTLTTAAKTDLVSAINEVNAAVASGTGALQTEVNNIETAAGLAADGTFVAYTGTNYVNTATSLKNADVLLDTALFTESTVREAADTTLTNNLAAEVTAREAADTTLTNNLAAEATLRANADTTLQSNITAEASTRLAADVAEESARIAADALKVNKAGDSLTGNLTFGGTATVTGLAAPVNATDATTKNYVDSLVSGLSWKQAVDSVGATNPGTAAVGYRFLNLTDGKIYTATALDTFDAGVAPVDGDSVFDRTTETGYVYSGTAWTQFTGTGQIAAGVGLVKTGNIIDVNLGAGIAQLPTDEVGIDLFANTALILTTDGTTVGTGLDAAEKLALKLGINGGLSQSSAAGLAIDLDETVAGQSGLVLGAGGVKIGAGKVTNAMLANSSITMNGSTGSSVVDLGETFAIMGDNTTGIVTTMVDNSNTLTISGITATSSQKGMASFGTDFTVTSGDVALSTTGVSAGSAGSSTAIPVITVDAKGRVTALTTAAIDTGASATDVTTTGTVVGDVVYVSASGAVSKAQANSGSTVKVAGVVSATGKIVTAGVVGGLSGLTPGARYFLSEATAGALTATPPTTGYVAPVGIAVTATTLAIQIGMPIQL